MTRQPIEKNKVHGKLTFRPLLYGLLKFDMLHKCNLGYEGSYFAVDSGMMRIGFSKELHPICFTGMLQMPAKWEQKILIILIEKGMVKA